MIYRKFRALVYLAIPIWILLLFSFGIQFLIERSVNVNGFLVFLYFSLGLSFGMLIIALRMFLPKKYGKGGELELWHDQTYKLMGEYWMQEVFNILELWRSNIKIVNPSANKGLYDKGLAEGFLKRGMKAKFYLFDLEEVENHVEEFEGNYVSLYYREKKNAFDIKSNLNELDVQLVDVIWDVKGCLWYSKRKTIQALRNYHDALLPGGCIIIDAMRIGKTEARFNKILGDVTGKYRGFAEVSTWKKIRKYIIDQDVKLKDEFDSMFEVSFYDLDHDHKVRIACLKKR